MTRRTCGVIEHLNSALVTLVCVVSALTSVLLSMPDVRAQTTVAGFTPASFRVSETGAATYTIPIQVPPGIAGMEPKLAFTYNSKGGNGLLGMGWGLSGLSAITRCPRTLSQDGAKAGVNFSSNDRFCLDGQRLVMISPSPAAYGSDSVEYRTERESFTKVISYGQVQAPGSGPQWFKVWTKAGQILEYGNTGDSQIEAQGKSSVRVWALNKTSDKKGNYLTVTYAEDNANGDFYPTRIDYNYTGATPNASVQFVPEPTTRPDVVPTYVAGSVVKTLKRLAYARTYVGASLVKEYRLAYVQSPATGRSRLTNITECAGDQVSCLPPRTFAWQDGGSGFHTAGTSPTVFVDASGWNGGLRYFQMDVDGDGRGDLVGRGGDGTLYTYLSNGATFAPSPAGPSPTTFSDAQGWNSGLRFFQMDVDGDGRGDLVGRGGDGTLYTYLSNGAKFTLAGTSQTVFSDAQGWNSGLRFFLLDVNGDGRGDLVGRGGDGTLYTYLSNGATFTPAGTTPATGFIDASGWNSGLRYFLMDVNGDGKGDLVGRGGDGTLYTFLSNGATFTPAGPTPTGFIDASGWNSGLRYFLMDVNGDGKGDLVGRYADGTLATLQSNGLYPDLLVSITDALGAVTQFTYKPLTDATVYTKGSGASYPVVDLQIPLYVVSSTRTTDGSFDPPLPIYTNYNYSGLKAHQQGGGLLGFAQVKATDVQTNIATATNFRQDYPFQGLPLSVSKTAPSWSGTLLANGWTTSLIPLTPSTGKYHRCDLTSSQESGVDLNGAALPTITTISTYDSFGNPQSVAVSASDGYTKTTGNDYFDPDTVNWILGRVKQSTVTSVTP